MLYLGHPDPTTVRLSIRAQNDKEFVNNPMNTEKRVSYLISTKNRAEYLDRTLQNVREFISPEDELIIIDGGSIDSTAQIVEKNCDIVTLFHSEPDNGEAHGFNKGILAAKGKWIKLVTDDDYFYPDAVKYAVSVLKINPDLDAIQCGGEAYEVNPATKNLELVTYEYLPSGYPLMDINNIYRFIPCGLGLFIKRDCFAKVGLLNTTFRMVDVEYMSKLIFAKANFKYLNVKLYRHITYPHSGQNQQYDSHRDRARIFIRHQSWEQLLSRSRIVVGDILGINLLSKGGEYIKIMYTLEGIRKRAPWVILVIGYIAEGYEFLLRVFHKLNRLFQKTTQKSSGFYALDQNILLDPHWDGTLTD